MLVLVLGLAACGPFAQRIAVDGAVVGDYKYYVNKPVRPAVCSTKHSSRILLAYAASSSDYSDYSDVVLMSGAQAWTKMSFNLSSCRHQPPDLVPMEAVMPHLMQKLRKALTM